MTSDTFGPKIKSIIAALSGFYKNSKQEVANIMKDIFNLDISVGSVSNSEARVAEKCEEAYKKVEREVRRSEILHIQSLQQRQIRMVVDVCKQNRKCD